MLDEKFKEIIKKIRKENNLTQKDLADKYHVTYQAVSKWENGKSLPDITLIRQISKDYNISIDDMMDGIYEEKKINNKRRIMFVAIPIFLIIIVAFLILLTNNSNDKGFESKTISSSCNDYKISGIISYNETKSVIYIPKIEYCGEKSDKKYGDINCTLYEKHGDVTKKISEFNYNDKKITIEEFMRLVSFNVDNYLKVCNSYNKESLYLEIKASDNDEMFFHTIPLSLDDTCN